MAKHTDFSRIFIDRPILATVLSALILVSGLMAIPNLPISEYPDVVPPSVTVTANYPGANPRTIADTVAGPLEEAVNGVENMIYMKSTSSSDGAMSLAVTFKGGTDIDLAAMQVQNRVAQALPRLPEAVRALGVTTVKASSTLTMVVHLDSPNKTYDALYLSNFANLHVRDELARLPGVGQALAFGIGNYAMRVWIDPERASARGLSASDIVNAIREQNVEVSAGSIGSPPTPDGSVLQISVNAQGRLASPEAFGEIVLKAEGDQLTRLKDVARIELGANSYAIRSLLNNEDAAAIVIFEAPGANTIELSDAIRNRMSELEGSFPEDVHWSVVYDPTVFVRDSIASVIETLLEAIALVVIVVVLFLQTWRASLIPLVAVPVSIIGTLRGPVAARLLDQRADAVRPRARDRHRRGRRDRRRRKRRAAHRSRQDAARGRAPGDERGVGPDRRDHAGAVVGVRAARLPGRRDRPVLQAVRGDDRGRGHHLRLQFADPVAGARRDAAAAARREEGRARALDRADIRPAVRRVQSRVPRLRRPLLGRHRRHHRPRAAPARDLRRAGRRDRRRLPRRAGRLHPVPGQAVPVRGAAAARGRDHRPNRCRDAQDGRDRDGGAGRRERRAVPGPERRALRRDAERRRHVRRARAAGRARARGRRDREPHQHGLRPDPGGPRLRAAAAARARPRQCERTRALRGGPRRHRLRRALQQHDRADRRAWPDRGLRSARHLHVLPVERAAARRERRPHQGQGARPLADRRLQHAAGLSRLGLRQRLQPVRAYLFGVRAGRCAVPRDRAGHRGPEGPQQPRRNGAARQRRGHQAELRPGPGDPLQRLPGCRPVGRPQSRTPVLDRGRSKRCGRWRTRSCRAAWTSNGPA